MQGYCISKTKLDYVEFWENISAIIYGSKQANLGKKWGSAGHRDMFYLIMSVCFRFNGISHQRLHWGEGALTSVLIFLFLSECVIENYAVACTPFIMFLLPRKGQHTHTRTHTKTHAASGTDWVYILGCTVLTMGDKGAKGQFITGQTHTHACTHTDTHTLKHTHQLCTFNQYILVDFCLY